MLQISFGISERDVLAVFEKYWQTAINPDQRSPAEMTRLAWRQMDEENMDNFANAAMDAFLENQNETEAARGEVRKFLIEHHFLMFAPRRPVNAPDSDILHTRRRSPERRYNTRHL